jgi:hypothetical protein
MPDYDDRAIAPPSSATVIGIVVVSIVILIASGYMIYNYSNFRPSPPAQTTSTTAR